MSNHSYPKWTGDQSGSSVQQAPEDGTSSDYTQGRTTFQKRGQPKARPKRSELVEAEQLPAMVKDPFNQNYLLDLTAAPQLNFNLVDGSVAVATDPQMPFVLFKGYNPDTWFYAPRWGRIAKGPTGEPAFLVTKKVRNNPDGSKTTVGGVLSFMIELVVELPSGDQIQKWTNLIKTLYNLQPSAGAFNFQPLRLSPGKMDVFGLDMYAREGQNLKGIDVGASSSLGFAIELTPDGADHFANMVGASPSPFPPQVAIRITFYYQYLIPQCDIQVSGFKKKCYDYFSANVKARASYFGLVNGSFDYQSVRADMRSMQAFNTFVVGTPPAGVDLQKLLDATFDMFVKMEVGQWIQPDPKPVEAPEPGGFFGGVSVAMKDISLSDSAQFDSHMSFASINENIHQVSFNFEQQLGAFDPAKHVFIEQSDIKLPFKLAIGNCNKVKMIVPSASYTTATGPQSVQCNTVSGDSGGLSEGIIQFTWPQQPTSAQISLIVNFISPFGPGYEFHSTKPLSDTGAAFLFEPDQFVQRTQIFFVMAAAATDLGSKALFKWEWTPPQTGDTPRPKISGFTLIAPDQQGDFNNLPTYDIEFPFHPNDWTGESTPKIQYKIQGLTGEWKNRTASGAISIGETAMAFDWEEVTSIGQTLAIPALLTRAGIPDPAYRRRLTAQYGQYLGEKRRPSLAMGGKGKFSGAGPATAAAAVAAAVLDPQAYVPLGYKPDKKKEGEPTLFERELIAKANLTTPMRQMAAFSSYPSSCDLRDVDGQNFITGVGDQGYCGSCVAWGVCAAVEGTLQVRRGDPYLFPDFSEAHLFYCIGRSHGRSCGNSIGDPPTPEPNGGWWPGEALDEFQWTGVADEECFPYVSPPSPFDPTIECAVCSDWSGRVTRISGWTVLSVAEEIKSWISGGRGPLVGAFTVYQDFLSFFASNTDPGAIYRKSSNPGVLKGGHCICVVGYSDEEQCWICKNSWGPYWADQGFFKIGYGEVGIDSYMWGVDIS